MQGLRFSGRVLELVSMQCVGVLVQLACSVLVCWCGEGILLMLVLFMSVSLSCNLIIIINKNKKWVRAVCSLNIQLAIINKPL